MSPRLQPRVGPRRRPRSVPGLGRADRPREPVRGPVLPRVPGRAPRTPPSRTPRPTSSNLVVENVSSARSDLRPLPLPPKPKVTPTLLEPADQFPDVLCSAEFRELAPARPLPALAPPLCPSVEISWSAGHNPFWAAALPASRALGPDGPRAVAVTASLGVAPPGAAGAGPEADEDTLVLLATVVSGVRPHSPATDSFPVMVSPAIRRTPTIGSQQP